MNRGRFIQAGFASLAAFLLTAGLASAVTPTIPTVGVYDETTTQNNNVDFTTTASNRQRAGDA
jgi:hypothetical protein